MENVDINMNHVNPLLLVKFAKTAIKETTLLRNAKIKIHEVQDSDDDSDIFLNSVETEKQVNDWKVNVKILKKNVSLKLDIGDRTD